MTAQSYFDDVVHDDDDHGSAVLPREIVELLQHLTDAGRAQLLTELEAAVAESQFRGSMAPLHDVLEAWTRTMKIVRAEGAVERITDAYRPDVEETEEFVDVATLLGP